MIKLIKNEFVKLFSRKVVYVFLLISITFMGLICYLNSYYEADEVSLDYQTTAIAGLEETLTTLEEGSSQYISTMINIYETNALMINTDSWVIDYIKDNEIIIENYYKSLYEEGYLEEEIQEAYFDFKTLDDAITNNSWKIYISEKISVLELELSTNLNVDLPSDYEELLNYEITLLNKRLEENIAYDNSYLSNTIETAIDTKEEIYMALTLEGGESYVESLKLELLEYEYIIDNNIDASNDYGLVFQFENFVLNYCTFIIMFAIFIAGTILSNEFTSGTIKGLLTTPYNRTKVLISKFITVIVATLLFSLTLLLFQIILGAIFFEISDFSVPILTYNLNANALVAENIIFYTFKQLIVFMPTVIFLALIAYVVTILFANSGIVIALTFIAYLFSELLNSLAINFEIEAWKYFITINWDFTAYMYGGTNSFDSITLGFSFLIYLIYFICISFIGIKIFTKKNIKNI